MTPEILQEIYNNNYVSCRMEFVACGDSAKTKLKKFYEVGNLRVNI